MPNDQTSASSMTLVAAFIEGELGRAEESARSVDQRVTFVITSSGTFVSILLAALAIGSKQKDFSFPTGGSVGIVCSLVFFVAAATLALSTFVPFGEGLAIDLTSSRDVLQKFMNDAEGEGPAREALALAQLEVAARVRSSTQRRTTSLVFALLMELFAIVSLAVAVAFVAFAL